MRVSNQDPFALAWAFSFQYLNNFTLSLFSRLWAALKHIYTEFQSIFLKNVSWILSRSLARRSVLTVRVVFEFWGRCVEGAKREANERSDRGGRREVLWASESAGIDSKTMKMYTRQHNTKMKEIKMGKNKNLPCSPHCFHVDVAYKRIGA